MHPILRWIGAVVFMSLPLFPPVLRAEQVYSPDRREIARGENVHSGEFPFTVLVWQWTDREEGRGYLCTGSLLEPDWVLTAAHCVLDEEGEIEEVEDFEVLSGVEWNEFAAKATALKLIPHPRYSHLILGTNDIALIQLETPLSGGTIQVLDSRQERRHAPSGTTSIAIGWGETEEGERPDFLQKVSVPLYSRSECQDRLRPFGFSQAPGTFCAGTAAEGTRSGDSGGPLLVDTGGEWGQVGVASLGSIDPELVGFPSTYVQTSLHHDWIYGHVTGTGENSEITLDRPSDFQAEALGPHRIRLSWRDSNGENAHGFRVERKPSGGSWDLLVWLWRNEREYIDGSVQPETTYSYRMYAYPVSSINAKNSPWSRTATVTTPPVTEIPASLSSGRHIPHIAQGQGWTTLISVLNTCEKEVTYDIDVWGADGRRQSFAFFGNDGERHNGLYNGEDPMTAKATHSFALFASDVEDKELLQGFGHLNDDGGGCIAVDTQYVQELSSGGHPFATIPLLHMTPATKVFTLNLFRSRCDYGVAIAGNGGTVRLEALDNSRAMIGSARLTNVHHTAFSLKKKIQDLEGETTVGQLRVTGESAAVMLEFCDGELAQFQLPNYMPLE